MILDEDGVLIEITGTQRFRCGAEVGCKNRAAWITEPKGGGAPIKMCGYHVLYGGSKWGEERKDEIVRIGRVIRSMALKTRTESTNVPKLDPRGRLGPDDAERYLVGVKRSTATARRLMGRIGLMRRVFGGD